MRLSSYSDLHPSKATLLSYSGDKIKPVGSVTLVYESPDCFEPLHFEVIDTKMCPSKPALLGISDSMKLGLVVPDKKRTYSPSTLLADTNSLSVNSKPCFESKDALVHQYKDSFEGLGKFGSLVDFKLDSSVEPVQAPVHRIPVAKRAAVKKKLDEMVAGGKIIKVDGTTEWCSNMTVVETKKPNGNN